MRHVKSQTSFAHVTFQPSQVPCISVGFPCLRAKYLWQLGTSAFAALLLPVLCAEIPGLNPWVVKHDFTVQASVTQPATLSSHILVLYKSSRSSPAKVRFKNQKSKGKQITQSLYHVAKYDIHT